jgi:hypothetical protein
VIRQVRVHPGIDVLVIDDGSTDDTAAVAMLRGAKVLRAPLWQGAWGAIQTGIRYALRHGYSGVVTMDCDGQHEPATCPSSSAPPRGRRGDRRAARAAAAAMRHIAWAYFRFLTGFALDDLTSGFRYYNARACRLLATEEATLLDYQDVGVLLLLHHARFRIAEIPVAMNPRKHGASRVFSSWWTVAVYMAETSLLCLARWNQNPKQPRSCAKWANEGLPPHRLVIGFGLAYGILHLVRRDHLYIRQGVFWIVDRAPVARLAIWPQFIDTLGGRLESPIRRRCSSWWRSSCWW